ncbi:hypothetical protein Q5752_003569 [Cryptotrichosporon argae]
MSDYQKMKERALALQREKEVALKRELEAKAEREKQIAREEEERSKKRDAAAKAARRLELMRANDALNKAPVAVPAASSMAYDPFAEDAIVPRSQTVAKAVTRPTKAGPSTAASPAMPRAPRVGPSTTSTTATASRRAHASVSPPPLGRREKAARAFAQATSKRSVEDGLFSVRALVAVAARGGSGSGSGSPSGRASPAPRPLPPTCAARAQPPPRRGNKAILPKMGKAMRGKPGEDALRKLGANRAERDDRTLDEIQRDIRARKGGPSVERRDKGASAGAAAGKHRGSPMKGGRGRSPPGKPPEGRRRRSPSDSASDSDDSSSPRARKRRRSPALAEDASRAEVSAVIRDLFRRPDRAPRPPVSAYDDDDSGSDMEAGLSDVEAEERRALRIARMEDEEDEAEERRRKEAKERARRERERRG